MRGKATTPTPNEREGWTHHPEARPSCPPWAAQVLGTAFVSPQNAAAICFSKRFSILVVISEEVTSWVTETEKGIEVACSEDGVENSVTEGVLEMVLHFL